MATEAQLNEVYALIQQALADGTATPEEAQAALSLATQYNVSPQRLELMAQASGVDYSEQDIRNTIEALEPDNPILNFDPGAVGDYGYDYTGGAPVDTGGTGGGTDTGGTGGGTGGVTIDPRTGAPVAQTNNDIYGTGTPAGGGGGGAGPGYIQGTGQGTGGTPNASAPDWAALEQANVEQQTAIQNSIFNNPNIYGPDGSSSVTTFGQLPDYTAYVQNNPDLIADFNSPENPFTDMAAYGQWHWQNQGNAEGRQLPTGSPADLGYLQPEVRTTLSPEEQAIFDTNQRSRGAMAAMGEQQLGSTYQALSTPFGFDGLPDPSQYLDESGFAARPTGLDESNVSGYTIDPTIEGYQAVADAIYDREAPFIDRQQEQLENQLLIEGHNPGSEAWAARMDDFNRQKNDLRLGAFQMAGDTQERLFGMEGMRRGQDFAEAGVRYDIGNDVRNNQIDDMGLRYDYTTADRNRQIEEQLLQRQQPLNELNALRTGSQVTMPGMSNYTPFGFNAPDIAGAEQEEYNRWLTERNRTDARKQGTRQAIGGIVSGAFSGGWF